MCIGLLSCSCVIQPYCLGVIDVDSYYSGKISNLRPPAIMSDILSFPGDWRDELVDADKDMGSFFDTCVAVDLTHALSMLQRRSNNLASLYNSLLTQPVPVVSSSFYGLVDYSVLRTAIWNAYMHSIYTPLSSQKVSPVSRPEMV